MIRNTKRFGIDVWFSKGLAFFLSKGRTGSLRMDMCRRASVKDIVESFGVPHTEVGRIRFNGGDRGFEFIPETVGLLEVFEITAPFDVFSGERLREVPVPFIKFVVDLNVLKLGQYLLFLGYDTVLAKEESDAQIADIAHSQDRIVLTRDTRLLFRRKIQLGRRIRAIHPKAQLIEVIRFFGLKPDPSSFFSRCAACNLPLEPVEKERIYHLLEPKTQRYVQRFHQCPGCLRIYWAGSHHRALSRCFQDLGLLNQD